MRFTASATLALGLSLLVLSATGCASGPRQVGKIEVQGSVTSYTYYAETQEDVGGKNRIFLFLDPATVTGWNNGAKEMPLSKTLIGKGPNKETLVIEQVKDADQSKLITRRLLATFNAKHNASVPLP